MFWHFVIGFRKFVPSSGIPECYLTPQWCLSWANLFCRPSSPLRVGFLRQNSSSSIFYLCSLSSTLMRVCSTHNNISSINYVCGVLRSNSTALGFVDPLPTHDVSGSIQIVGCKCGSLRVLAAVGVAIRCASFLVTRVLLWPWHVAPCCLSTGPSRNWSP